MLTVLDTFYLQSLQQQLQFSLATLEWCWVDMIYTISEVVAVKDITTGFMSGEHGSKDHPCLKSSGN